MQIAGKTVVVVEAALLVPHLRRVGDDLWPKQTAETVSPAKVGPVRPVLFKKEIVPAHRVRLKDHENTRHAPLVQVEERKDRLRADQDLEVLDKNSPVK